MTHDAALGTASGSLYPVQAHDGVDAAAFVSVEGSARSSRRDSRLAPTPGVSIWTAFRDAGA